MPGSAGPPYPHPNPKSGSNAIGKFAIGVSPIGDISSFDVFATVISQYSNSGTISQLCSNMGQYIDQTQNLDAFFDTLWNVDTAVGVGLDIWGRIVGVNRVVAVSSSSQPFLGFQEAGDPLRTPFGQAPFFSGGSLTTNFTLSDAAFRTLIFAKALANICDGSIPAINQLLLNLFPNRGNCYVTDGLNLTMTYTFAFVLSPVELTIVQNSGIIPRTAGVSVAVVHP